LIILREIGLRRTEGATLGRLAEIYARTGRPERAEQSCREALSILCKVGDRHLEGAFRCELACILVSGGKREEAGRTWKAGADLLREFKYLPELERRTAAMRQVCAKAGIASLAEEPRSTP
jgi:hypothetical protein